MPVKVQDADEHFVFAYNPDSRIVEHRRTHNKQLYITNLQINQDGSYTITATKKALPESHQ